MASVGSVKRPPLLSQQKSYTDWVRLLNLWAKCTTLDADKQGPSIVMTLEGKALDAVLELTDDELAHADGVKNIITKLDPIFKKDELNEKFSDLESFDSYKRNSSTGMQEFIAEFDKLFSKIKKHGATLSRHFGL